jgi:hypothetical protein
MVHGIDLALEEGLFVICSGGGERTLFTPSYADGLNDY